MLIAYFVPDLTDAAVERRVVQFSWGKANTRVVGFYRSAAPPASVAGGTPIPLCRTYNGKFVARLAMTLWFCLQRGRLFEAIKDADLIVARNLETLILAYWVRRLFRNPPRLVFECLDIHRKMLGSGIIGRILRRIERFLLGRVSAIIVSSPAFRDYYFLEIQKFAQKILVIENKNLDNGPLPRDTLVAPKAPPWVIGWFGILRCKKSLSMLIDLVNSDANVEVLIAGKPAYEEFDDFDALLAGVSGVHFEGPYKSTELASLYGRVHFTWAIDYFEEGLNSKWLLPNRLYEGTACGSVPIALAEVETGKWLKSKNAGILLESPERDLASLFGELTPSQYDNMRAAARRIPNEDLVFTAKDAEKLVAELLI